ncbi:MAG: protein-(glutamine-N5) methyltransferase, release factor-specific, partial [Gemmatimonadota bacterium]
MVEAAPTLGMLLADARARLGSAGVSDPARETLRIWADLAGRRPGDAVALNADLVAPEFAERLERAFLRRQSGEPLAYVTGIAGFRH